MSTRFYTACTASPLGWIKITGDGKKVLSLQFVPKPVSSKKPHKSLAGGLRQLKEYFNGQRSDFRLPLRFRGTPFQKKVWHRLGVLRSGETVSYADIARRIGRPKAARAVGSAIGKNPLPVLLPCHRVIASSGKLGGYSCGLSRKRWLLKHERDSR